MAANKHEQMFLELLNDARLDPLGDASRFISSYSPLHSKQANIQSGFDFFHVSGSALLKALKALHATQPLAWNDKLATSARAHDQQMISHDAQSHQFSGEHDPFTRMKDAGYTNLTAGGENIFAFTEDVLQGHAALLVDWGPGTNGMQSPAGHRANIMDADFREVGVGVVTESNPSTQVGPLVVTQDFATHSSNDVFILGVDYTDKDHNNFYSLGEGRSGLHVSVGAHTATSASAGGYTLETTTTGSHTIKMTGGGLAGEVDVVANLKAGMNLKLDVINGNTIHISQSATITGKFTTVDGLGLTGLHLTTGSGNQTIVGTKGSDTLVAGAGSDKLDGGAGGKDTLTGGTGKDIFLFHSSLSSSNVDHVTDFKVVDDTIRLENAIFKALTHTGTLATAAFHVGSAAADASDRVIYNKTTGALLYDSDGTGSHAAVQFATLAHNLALTHSDFVVI